MRHLLPIIRREQDWDSDENNTLEIAQALDSALRWLVIRFSKLYSLALNARCRNRLRNWSGSEYNSSAGCARYRRWCVRVRSYRQRLIWGTCLVSFWINCTRLCNMIGRR